MQKEFLVATCVCDSTGFVVGIVEAVNEKWAMDKLGTEIIGHTSGGDPDGDFCWDEYLMRHGAILDTDYYDFIKNQEGERLKDAEHMREHPYRKKATDFSDLPIKRATIWKDELETSFNRWILVAEFDHMPVGEYLVCYYDEEGRPFLAFVEEVNKGWLDLHPEYWIEIFKWDREKKVFIDVTAEHWRRMK